MSRISKTKKQIIARWFVCRVTSGRKSAQYGIRFSYPLFISIVVLGIFFVNPFILSIAALIAFLGVILPMHPFDYVHNSLITKLFHVNKIPGRGSELQINSIMALIFNLGVIASVLLEIQLNYSVLSLIYVLASIFFITIQLLTDNFSVYSLQSLIIKKDK